MTSTPAIKDVDGSDAEQSANDGVPFYDLTEKDEGPQGSGKRDHKNETTGLAGANL